MGTFRLLQFNMQFGQVWDSTNPDIAPVRLEDTVKTVVGYDADIILLQEVERAQPGGKQLNPPPNFAYLQDVLSGYESVFAYPPEDSRELPFGIGLAIFSRYPLQNVRSVVLPGAPVEFEFEGRKTTPTDRILQMAEVEIEGKILTILNTHLQAFFMIDASSDDYPQQRDRVLKEAGAVEGPLVMCGDFNSSPDEGLVAQFEGAGFQTMQNQEITWKRMPYVLDHIFFNDQLELKSGSVDDVAASDHHALVAEFEI